MFTIPTVCYFIATLFCGLASVCLSASICFRTLKFMWEDPHPVKYLASSYRIVILLGSMFMLIRSLPVASILLFDPHPQVLTLLTRVNYISIWVGFPVVALFAITVELTKQPILGRLLIPPVELYHPTKEQVLKEVKITVTCLILASLVILSKG